MPLLLRGRPPAARRAAHVVASPPPPPLTMRMNTSSSAQARDLDPRRRPRRGDRAGWPPPDRCPRRGGSRSRHPARSTRSTSGSARNRRHVGIAIAAARSRIVARIVLPPHPDIGSSSTLRPLWIMTTWSHISSACGITCVENRIVAPRACSSGSASAAVRDADRVEAAERLVENQQIRLVEDGADELHPLQHALRQLFAPLALDVAQAHAARARAGRARPRLVATRL